MRLGGLLVSLFFGMRLIGSVVGSKLVLGVTIVQSAVQVGRSAWHCRRALPLRMFQKCVGKILEKRTKAANATRAVLREAALGEAAKVSMQGNKGPLSSLHPPKQQLPELPCR